MSGLVVDCLSGVGPVNEMRVSSKTRELKASANDERHWSASRRDIPAIFSQLMLQRSTNFDK